MSIASAAWTLSTRIFIWRVPTATSPASVGEAAMGRSPASSSRVVPSGPTSRADGVMASCCPNVRGVITAHEGAEVFFDLTGRIDFVERDGEISAVSC